MKKFYILMLLTVIAVSAAYPAKHVVTNNMNSFSPAEITINVGDTVVFTIGGSHNAVEVSKETYDAKGNTSNNGFSVGFGGGSVAFTNAGTYYYVCQPHASLGMRGIIHVVTPSSVNEIAETSRGISLYPNPASNYVSISYTLTEASVVSIDLVSISGAVVKSVQEVAENPGIQHYTLDMPDDIHAGVYFIRIYTNKQELVQKLIIQ
jgi:plastocyanin